ncbi:P-beta [Drechslerella dactyloides]|uniref:p-beta n=1 Tax=Drechslerella dactyloides TaxID=74499 RepID=A0AAD6NEI4_DREDA|nr:P-beta [Drechslerella dactyloides]
MVPLWGPCAVRRAVSRVSSSSASPFAILCQPATGRLSLHLPESQSITEVSRALSTVSPKRTSLVLRQSTPIQCAVRAQIPRLQNTHRLFASLRRPSARRPDGPPASPPTPHYFQRVKSPEESVDLDGARLEPVSADRDSGSLAPTDPNHMKFGSQEWYEYYRERARLSDKDEPDEMHPIRRLLPSFVFMLVSLGGCFVYALTYVHPANKDRWFPTVPMALATVCGIIASNFLILVAWRIPPLWRTLNKYFTQCPGEPVALAVLGSVVSHQSLWHFACNMVALFFLGTTLCDQIGRGNFLALYFASGVTSSFASLAVNVIRRRFHVYGLGASGAIFGVVGAYAALNPNSELYFILLPFFTLKAVTMATIFGVYEFMAMLFGWSMWMDHAAHLFGLLTGAGLLSMLKAEAKRRRELMVAQQLKKEGAVGNKPRS